MERVQNGYRTDIEWIRNGNGSKKRKEAFWNANYKRTCSSEHILVSYAIGVLTKDLKMVQLSTSRSYDQIRKWLDKMS